MRSLLLLCALAGIAVIAGPRSTVAANSLSQAVAAPGIPGTYVLGLASGAITPVGDQYADVWWSPEDSHAAVQDSSGFRIVDLASGATAPLTTNGQGKVLAAQWSPDGSELAYAPNFGSGGVDVVPAAGLGALQITAAAVTELAWRPDGQAITIESAPSAGGGQGVATLSIDATTGETLATILPPTTAFCPRGLVWSADGAYLAFADGGFQNPCGDPQNYGLWVWDSASGALAHLDSRLVYGGPQWTPDGRIFVEAVDLQLGTDEAVLVAPDGSASTLLASGLPMRVLGAGPVQYAAGELLYSDYQCDSNTQVNGGSVFVVDPGAAGPRQISDPSGGAFGAALSPAGASVAWIRLGMDSNQLVLSDLSGAVQTLLIGPPGLSLRGWSPDGRTLVFSVGDASAQSCI